MGIWVLVQIARTLRVASRLSASAGSCADLAAVRTLLSAHASGGEGRGQRVVTRAREPLAFLSYRNKNQNSNTAASFIRYRRPAAETTWLPRAGSRTRQPLAAQARCPCCLPGDVTSGAIKARRAACFPFPAGAWRGGMAPVSAGPYPGSAGRAGPGWGGLMTSPPVASGPEVSGGRRAPGRASRLRLVQLSRRRPFAVSRAGKSCWCGCYG